MKLGKHLFLCLVSVVLAEFIDARPAPQASNLDPATVKKIKTLISKLNVDVSKIDFDNLNLAHKYDGKDSLQPSMCHDKHNDRYGVGKHFVRGTRDVGFAIVSEAQAILDPLLGGITLGVGNGLKALLCALEDGFSDFGSDFDSATDIAKNGLVNFFKLQGPNPILGIPLGIVGIGGEAVKAAGSIAGDAVSGVENAVGQLAAARNVNTHMQTSFIEIFRWQMNQLNG
ncbi:uncharacterized protein TNCT_240641 [Trichonephila clavata]|uniref:Uncharacterized protein n=1 Tax=Trichonephila clavata TaxID=2740835 RepID=A0A8X6KQV0_TRICU|nr:uncharacterized protein TNCT_240641 [Trichonephila clavata]